MWNSPSLFEKEFTQQSQFFHRCFGHPTHKIVFFYQVSTAPTTATSQSRERSTCEVVCKSRKSGLNMRKENLHRSLTSFQHFRSYVSMQEYNNPTQQRRPASIFPSIATFSLTILAGPTAPAHGLPTKLISQACQSDFRGFRSSLAIASQPCSVAGLAHP